MGYTRSTIIIALSMVMASQSALASDKPLKTYLPSDGMNEIFAGRLKVKIKGADTSDGNPAQPTLAQIKRFSAKLQGGKFVSGLSHGGWTVWEFPANTNPRLAAEALMSDPDVIVAEPENKLYPVSLPVPNDPDWAYIETSPTYI